MTQKQDAENSEELGFISHLLELRDRLLRIAMVLGVVFIILFPFAQDLYQWLAAPVLAQGQGLIAIGPIAPVLIPYKVALLTAFLIALPYVFYQAWSFIAPGLYKHEKRLIIPLLTSSVALFYVGIAFAYYLLLPMIFKIVQVMTPEGVAAIPDVAAYLDFVMMIFIAFGFGFEMPIATILIISTGMTTAEKLGKKRPYIIVGSFILGMLLTPPDVISQLMLAVPMWLLFEIGLFLSRYFVDEVKAAARARERLDKKQETENDDKPEPDAYTTHAMAAATSASHGDLWEDDDYTYEEDDDVNLDDEFVPMTDEEMEAELDRLESEESEESEESDKKL